LVVLAGPLIAYYQVGHSFSNVLIGFLISLTIVGFEYLIQRTPLDSLIVGIIGIVLGLIAAKIVDYGALFIDNRTVDLFFEKYSLLIKILFAYFGLIVAVNKKDEIELLDKDIFKLSNKDKIYEPVILDTSAVIDGRIYDIAETKFLMATLVIPKFILNELQRLADSNDAIKRNRAKRGLNIVAKLQKSENIISKIYDKDYPQIKDADTKLVELAKESKAKIVTTDFNLNKIASIQGVSVLNINDLGNSLTPAYLPGENFMIFLIKEGSQQNQAVGYLDDGTMVVAEDGRKFIGKRVELTVTSIIQNSSGRMVFGKISDNNEMPAARKNIKEKERE
ncbi:MAG: hypothetical protein LBO62_05375, partial [Endomicrobium sp.]|nr:hypothetical protein [Endomicrobium sp.]